MLQRCVKVAKFKEVKFSSISKAKLCRKFTCHVLTLFLINEWKTENIRQKQIIWFLMVKKYLRNSFGAEAQTIIFHSYLVKSKNNLHFENFWFLSSAFIKLVGKNEIAF